MKRRFWLGGIIFLLEFFAFSSSDKTIVAYVNEEVITKNDVCNLADEARLTYDQALDRLIDQCLLLQDFNSKKGKIPEAQLDVQMDNIVQESFKGNRSALSQVLRMKGQTFFGLKEEVKTSIILNVMQQQKAQSPYSISPKKIKEYYQSHKKEFEVPASYVIEQSGFKAGSKMLMQEEEKNKGEVLEKYLADKMSLDEIKRKLDEFTMEAMEYKASELDVRLVNHLDKMLEGQSTDYLKINDVYITAKLLKKNPARIKTLAEVQSEIEEKLLVEINQKNYQDYIDLLKKNAAIQMIK